MRRFCWLTTQIQILQTLQSFLVRLPCWAEIRREMFKSRFCQWCTKINCYSSIYGRCSKALLGMFSIVASKYKIRYRVLFPMNGLHMTYLNVTNWVTVCHEWQESSPGDFRLDMQYWNPNSMNVQEVTEPFQRCPQVILCINMTSMNLVKDLVYGNMFLIWRFSTLLPSMISKGSRPLGITDPKYSSNTLKIRYWNLDMRTILIIGQQLTITDKLEWAESWCSQV